MRNAPRKAFGTRLEPVRCESAEARRGGRRRNVRRCGSALALGPAGSLENANSRGMSAEPNNSFGIRTYEECACKSRGMRTYGIFGLELPWNQHLHKKGGGGGVASVGPWCPSRPPRLRRCGEVLFALSRAASPPVVDFFALVASNVWHQIGEEGGTPCAKR